MRGSGQAGSGGCHGGAPGTRSACADWLGGARGVSRRGRGGARAGGRVVAASRAGVVHGLGARAGVRWQAERGRAVRRAGQRPGAGARQRREKGRGKEKRKEKRKEEKEKRGKRNGKKGKEIGKKKNGREGRKRRGAVRASGDRVCGRPRVACGRGRWGHAVGGERGKRRGEKGGAGFAAAGHDASRWMGKRWDAD